MSREAFLSRLRVMSATMLAIFAASVLFGATLAAGFSWHNAGASIGTAALTGLPIFTFELFFVNSMLGAGFRRWPFLRFVVVRFAVWFAWIFVATQLSRHWLWGAEGEMLAGANFWWTILFSFAVGFVVVSALTLNRLIGPGVLRNFLLGRYHAPREEQRGLLFVDLVGSTAIAERIGATRFLALMNQFVYDIGGALEGSGGAIYRYVGDEAIISLARRRDSRPLRCGEGRLPPACPDRGPWRRVPQPFRRGAGFSRRPACGTGRGRRNGRQQARDRAAR